MSQNYNNFLYIASLFMCKNEGLLGYTKYFVGKQYKNIDSLLSSVSIWPILLQPVYMF